MKEQKPLDGYTECTVPPDETGKYESELVNMVDEICLERARTAGAHAAAVIRVSGIRFDRSYRAMCESNACGNYGRCWMCPPDAGEIDGLIRRAASFDKALVYQTVGKLEDSYDFEGMMEGARRHNVIARRIAALFRTPPPSRTLHLGAGGCHVCAVCAKQTGEPCRRPGEAVASLEAYGIAVSELAAACGLRYSHGQDTVTYFGAVLWME